jgi:hypothetical protein
MMSDWLCARGKYRCWRGWWVHTDKTGQLQIAKDLAAQRSKKGMAPAALTFWLFATIVDGFVVFLCVRQKVISRFFYFSCYFAALIVVSIGRFWVLSRDGPSSAEYLYFYYYSDAVLTILLALAIWQIGVRLITGRVGREIVLIGGASILLLVTFFSLSIAAASNSRLITHVASEISQNGFLTAGLATLVLWTWNLFNEAEDRIAAQLVNVLAVYFALLSVVWELEQARLFYRGINDALFSMSAAWLPLGSSFALVRDQ